jgi:transcriptional regulator with XRE-family HTH domain
MLFQERVCEAIKNSGMTQKQIAEKLHIREGNITNWKKGLNLPSIEVFYQLCLLLDESADYLLGITD